MMTSDNSITFGSWTRKNMTGNIWTEDMDADNIIHREHEARED